MAKGRTYAFGHMLYRNVRAIFYFAKSHPFKICVAVNNDAVCSLTLFNLEQALYVVQILEPIGVGARSLSENLIIQLANSEHFNEATVHIALSGLELLSTRDYRALAKEMENRIAPGYTPFTLAGALPSHPRTNAHER